MSLPKIKQKPGTQSRLTAAINQVNDLQSELAQALSKMESKVQQLERITRFSNLMNSTLDTAEVREQALQATCEILQCETASLYLIDKEKNELFWDAALGEAGKELQKKFRLPINERSIAGYVALHGESILVNDVENDPRHFKKANLDTAFRVKDMVVVPLRNKHHLVGVLQAINKVPNIGSPGEGFHEEDLRILESLGSQVAIAIENAQLYVRLKKSFYDTVEALVEAIEKKDRYTGGHTKRVVHYSMCIADYLEMSAEDMDRIRLGAVLHDVGKIGIEDKIRKKEAPLDEYEWPQMQKHPEIGYEILKKVEGLSDVIDGMRLHHERWDGKGYPLGLKGEAIPLLARIISVADTYDAMVSSRPYRKGLDIQIAYDEIVKHSGTQFCPTVVGAFKKAFENSRLRKRRTP